MLTARTRRTTCFRRKCTRSQMNTARQEKAQNRSQDRQWRRNLPVSLILALHERVRRGLAVQIRGILLEQHETVKETQLPQAELMQEHEAAALHLPGAGDVREAGMLPFRFIIC